MVQGKSFIYQEISDILSKEAADQDRIGRLSREKASLASERVCALDEAAVRKALSILVDQWNGTLLNDAYGPVIKRVVRKFNDDYLLRRKQLPPKPELPAGFKDLKDFAQKNNSYVKRRDELEREHPSRDYAVVALRKQLTEYFYETSREYVRSQTATARDAFAFFKRELKDLNDGIPKKLRKYIEIGIHAGTASQKSYYMDPDGSFAFSPDFTYASGWAETGLMTDCSLVLYSASQIGASMLEKMAGNDNKAREWVEGRANQFAMIDMARQLVNALMIKESEEKELRAVKRTLAGFAPFAAEYNEWKRQSQALDAELEGAGGLKGYAACGAFLVRKNLLKRLGDEDLSTQRKKYAAQLKEYGLLENELSDIQWPALATSAENAGEARKNLINHLVQRCLERVAYARRRRKEIDKEISDIEAQESYVEKLMVLQSEDPLLNQIISMDEEHVKTLMECAKKRKKVVLIPTGQMVAYSKGKDIFYPETVPWHVDGKAANICLLSEKGQENLVYNTLNNLLFNMLMAFPPGKVRLHFVDLNLSGRGKFFLLNFDSGITGSQAVTDEASFRELVSSLQNKMSTAGMVEAPYDVVVLLDAPKQLTSQQARMLQPLCENGYKIGISFVAVDTGFRMQGDGSAILSDESFYQVPLAENSTSLDTLYENLSIRELCLSQFRKASEETSRTPVVKLDVKALKDQEYAPSGAGIRVPVGSGAGHGFDFRLDQEGHPHAFVLGQSGSGKSVFLRDVILGAALKYAPEDLQFYLIDLKAGGIEFNGYEQLPHSKAVLLDDSDRRIILEILRDISRELDRRGECIRNASQGIVTLEEYNRKFPEDRLSQVMIIVDECQRLFSDRPDAIQKEICDIMDKIAEMGRAFGIHLVLATQTLHGSVISAKVRKNISDFYLLRGGMADGIERYMDEASKLDTGQVLYTDKSEKSLFQAFYLEGEAKAGTISAAREKAAGHRANGQFVFTGKTSFNLRPEDSVALRASARRGPAAIVGREISVGLAPLSLSLQEDMSENMLILGAKTSQAASLAVQAYLGMMLSDKGARKPHEFYAIDCLDDPEMEYSPLLDALELHGSKPLRGKERGELLASLADKVRKGTATPAVVLVLSQERLRPLMMDTEIPTGQGPDLPPSNVPAFLQPGTRNGAFPGQKKTYRSELAYLLEHGSEQGVHFIVEVDRLSNLLGDATLSRQSLMRMFHYILMLRSVSDSVLRLGLPTEVDPDKLNDADGRVRAWCIDLLNNRFRLFTPLRTTRKDEVDDLFNA